IRNPDASAYVSAWWHLFQICSQGASAGAAERGTLLPDSVSSAKGKARPAAGRRRLAAASIAARSAAGNKKRGKHAASVADFDGVGGGPCARCGRGLGGVGQSRPRGHDRGA